MVFVMITKHKTNIIKYLVICVNDFAVRFDIDRKSAFNFLSEYRGIEFLIDHYEMVGGQSKCNFVRLNATK